MNQKKAKQMRRRVKQLQKQINPNMPVGAIYTDRDPKTGVIELDGCIRGIYQNVKKRMKQNGV